MNNGGQRIALWNTAFLGDAVLTMPLAETLHREFPGVPLDLYVRGGFEPLFAANPVFSAVYGVNKKNRSLSSIRLLGADVKKRQYSLWVAAHTSVRSGLVARLSGAPQRLGYSETPLARLWFSKTTSRRFSELDEIERLLELAKLAGCRNLLSEPHIVLPQETIAATGRMLHKLGCRADRPVLGLHPGSVWPTKRWPAAYFAEIGRRALLKAADVIVFAGPGEEDIAGITLDALRQDQPDSALRRIHDLSGKLSLLELAACIAHLSCYVTNDSGPMHLSWAQQVPTVAVFGPTVRELGFFPRGPQSHVVEIPLDCRPCGLHGHKECPLKHHNCMKKVLPDMVWARVEPYMAQAGSSLPAFSRPD